MTYTLDVHPDCQKELQKLCKKNPVLKSAIEKKTSEIIENPYHYKPLQYDLIGERRVHIMKSFVLKFEIVESIKVVRLISFGHHDDAYRR